jgi:hypothetical protein
VFWWDGRSFAAAVAASSSANNVNDRKNNNWTDRRTGQVFLHEPPKLVHLRHSPIPARPRVSRRKDALFCLNQLDGRLSHSRGGGGRNNSNREPSYLREGLWRLHGHH